MTRGSPGQSVSEGIGAFRRCDIILMISLEDDEYL